MDVKELSDLLALILKSQEEHTKTLDIMVQYINNSAEIIKRQQDRINALETKVARLEKIKVDKIVKDFFN